LGIVIARDMGNMWISDTVRRVTYDSRHWIILKWDGGVGPVQYEIVRMEVIEDQPPPSASDLEIRLDRIRMIVERAVASGEKYPICLDDVWKGLNFTTKSNAVRVLLRACVKGNYFSLKKQSCLKQS
jgi:hypothetical protein